MAFSKMLAVESDTQLVGNSEDVQDTSGYDPVGNLRFSGSALYRPPAYTCPPTVSKLSLAFFDQPSVSLPGVVVGRLGIYTFRT
jgi:hypothetical protein